MGHGLGLLILLHLLHLGYSWKYSSRSESSQGREMPPTYLGQGFDLTEISQRQGGIAQPPCWAQAFQKGQGGGQQGRAVALRVRAVGMHRALPWAGDEPVKSLLSLMISLSFCNSVLSGKKISLKKINHRVTH